jgi:hypothetical protein
MPSGGIEQHTGADDIGVDEVLRGINTAVDVRFGREINDGIKLMFRHQGIHLISIRDIRFEEFVTIAMLLCYTCQIRQIASVSEHVDVGYISRLVMFQNVANKVAPNETAAAGH